MHPLTTGVETTIMPRRTTTDLYYKCKTQARTQGSEARINLHFSKPQNSHSM